MSSVRSFAAPFLLRVSGWLSWMRVVRSGLLYEPHLGFYGNTMSIFCVRK